MQNKEENNVLLLDEADAPIIIQQECEKIKSVIKEFVEYYAQNRDRPVDEWLTEKMQEQLPEYDKAEVKEMAEEIITSLNIHKEKQASLTAAVNSGRSKESWFASETKKATSAMAAQEASKYLTGIDEALKNANESLYRTITTQAGVVSRNPCLDGFIAEQYHAQTFNLNAIASGSEYRAKVLEPNGGTYGKNSVDIVIIDKDGNIVRKYQAKYCKDAYATERAFANGDYRGQRKVVPAEQQAEISKKASAVLEAPDGTTSNPLTKAKAVDLKDEAQSGNWNDLNWNEYAVKDLAAGIGRQAGYAALQGAAIGVGFEVAQKVWNGEEIEGDKIVETAITSGADFGIKAATAGALKVGVEKEIITVIPKGTPAGTFANIAHIAIEDIKVVGKIATGELSLKEGFDKIEQTTVSTAAGLVAMGEGAAFGATIGATFGPVGAAIGGFVGGTVSYMAGTKIGEQVAKGAQKLRDGACKVLEKVGERVKNTFSNAIESAKNFGGTLLGFLGF